MSSLLDSDERCIPSINPGLSIPELIKIVNHSFRGCEFNEVQNILMDREKKMKIEIEDLKRDLDSIKKEARLLDRSQSLAELEKLRLEEKLQRSRMKCEELSERITRLTEEERVSCDRAKRAEERYENVSQENSKMSSEKNKLIFELNWKINELKSKNLENERLVGEYKDKVKCLNARVVEMGQEIVDLRREKLALNQTVEELMQKQFEADQVVEELKRQNLEATRSLDGLRWEKMEADCRLEDLAPRVTKMEAQLANMLNVKVENLANLVDLPDIFKGGKGSLENDSTNADAEKVVMKSSGVRYASNSSGSGGIALSKKGSHASVTRSGGGARCSSKMACSSSAARDVIEICDSDDETKPGDTTYISDTSSAPTNKRNRREFNRGFSPESDYKEEKKHLQKRRG